MIKCNNGGVNSVNLAMHNNKKRNYVSKPAPKNEEKGKGVARPPAEKDQLHVVLQERTLL
jgi:hypothetical protein